MLRSDCARMDVAARNRCAPESRSEGSCHPTWVGSWTSMLSFRDPSWTRALFLFPRTPVGRLDAFLSESDFVVSSR